MWGKRPAQFGLLRTLTALCPGFGTAAAGVAWMEWTKTHAPELRGYTYAVLVGAWLILTPLFGWIDAMLNPSLVKTEGRIPSTTLVRAVFLFLSVQLLVTPPVLGFSALMLELLLE